MCLIIHAVQNFLRLSTGSLRINSSALGLSAVFARRPRLWQSLLKQPDVLWPDAATAADHLGAHLDPLLSVPEIVFGRDHICELPVRIDPLAGMCIHADRPEPVLPDDFQNRSDLLG